VTKLPAVSGEDVIKALKRAGYFIRRQKGSHVRLYHPTRPPVTVPLARNVKKGTLRSILRDAGIDVADFVDLLRA